MPDATSTNATPVNDAHGPRCGGCSGHAGHFIKDGRLWLWCAKCKRRWRWHSDAPTALFNFAPAAEHFENVIAQWPDTTPTGWEDRIRPEAPKNYDEHAFPLNDFVSPRPEGNDSPIKARTIRLRCIGAQGDVLIACMAAAAIKKSHSTARVVLETAHPAIVKDNPFIDAAIPPGAPFAAGERLLDLRPEADWSPKEHRLAKFCELCGVPIEEAEFFIRTEPLEIDAAQYVALHAGPTGSSAWVGRNWIKDRWKDLAKEMLEDGLYVVAIGDDDSIRLPPGVIDLRKRTNIYQMAGIVRGAHAFVGIESFPAIVAQGFGVPSVLFFGSILPRLRIFRKNVMTVSAHGLPCLGCHHDERIPKITHHCRVGGEPCQSEVSVAQFASAVRRAVIKLGGRRETEVNITSEQQVEPRIRIVEHEPTKSTTTIVIKRHSTIGDVLVAASVAEPLKIRHGLSKVIFQTDTPSPLVGHPFIDAVVPYDWSGKYDVLCNMDAACERLPYTNMLAVYAGCAGVPLSECRFYVKTLPIAGLPDRYAAMHIGPIGSPTRRWAGREWAPERFSKVAAFLAERQIATVLVGDWRKNDAGIAWPRGTVDLRGLTTIYQLAHVVKNAKLFVGLDSFPMHAAQVLNTPGVVFFGSIKPELRLFRENMSGVSATFLPCIGCHHDRRTEPDELPETADCKIGYELCRPSVSVERFIHAVAERIAS